MKKLCSRWRNCLVLYVSGPLAQSVERGADNAKVVSSTLTRTIVFFPYLLQF